MSRSIHTTITALTLVMLASQACGAESHGPCKFINPEVLWKLDHSMTSLTVLKRNTEPSSILVVDYSDLNDDGTKVAAIKLAIPSGEPTREYVPYDGSGQSWPPEGYTAFASSENEYPLIRSGKLRYVNLGKTEMHEYPQWSEGRWTTGRVPRFTGLRRLMYGNRPLFEQFLEAAEQINPIDRDVQIEPDGDRILCLCSDSQGGSWVGLFSQRKLESQQKATDHH